MAGKFIGLTDEQWIILEPLVPKDPVNRRKGKPHTPWRNVLNTIFWVLITGSRWADVPVGKQWGSRTASHRWLGIWQEDGRLDKMLAAIRATAVLSGKINWDRIAVDGFFQLAKVEENRSNMGIREKA